ncbi:MULTISPECIES: hypothetical protein [unclassified Mesorhizobium]|uniref:hypothetical protein n=1 Tax=unclassified Mesorhizobium TaxID=325217 RepID=UPI0033350283
MIIPEPKENVVPVFPVDIALQISQMSTFDFHLALKTQRRSLSLAQRCRRQASPYLPATQSAGTSVQFGGIQFESDRDSLTAIFDRPDTNPQSRFANCRVMRSNTETTGDQRFIGGEVGPPSSFALTASKTHRVITGPWILAPDRGPVRLPGEKAGRARMEQR